MFIYKLIILYCTILCYAMLCCTTVQSNVQYINTNIYIYIYILIYIYIYIDLAHLYKSKYIYICMYIYIYISLFSADQLTR